VHQFPRQEVVGGRFRKCEIP